MSKAAADHHVSAFAHELVAALINLEMHGTSSQEVRDSTRAMMYELSALFAAGHPDPLQLGIQDGCIMHQGMPLVSASLQARNLVNLCSERVIAGLRIGSRIDAAQLLAFLRVLSDPDHSAGFQTGHGPGLLTKAGVFHLEIEQHREPTTNAPGNKAMEHYQALADCLQESHIAAFRGHDLSIEKACGVIEAALDQVNAPAGLLALASHEFIDSFTVGHSVRVALLALQTASAGNASRSDLVRVGTAGLLHDIGKSRIPQEILFKRGRLTEEERQIMSLHPRLGGELLLEQPQLDPTTIGAAFCHHMPPRGGYPRPTLPFEPSGISKLIQVCDVFEALTAVRPYKRAMTPLEAYAVMYRHEQDFDAEWLRFFIRALGVYPQGTFLVLDTGEIGMVTAQGPTPTRPIVEILTSANGDILSEHQILSCALGEDIEGVVRNVQEDVPGNPLVAPDHAHDPHDPEATTITSCCGHDLTGEMAPK